jgi:hypothetical protein
MAATSLPPAPVGSPTGHSSPKHGFPAALDDRRLALAAVGPNWFASVMGTSDRGSVVDAQASPVDRCAATS